jgi:hypothetical protein
MSMLVARQSSLFFITFAIVANTQKIMLEATMTARGYVALETTQLTGNLSTTRWAARTWTTSAVGVLAGRGGGGAAAGLPPPGGGL